MAARLAAPFQRAVWDAGAYRRSQGIRSLAAASRRWRRGGRLRAWRRLRSSGRRGAPRGGRQAKRVLRRRTAARPAAPNSASCRRRPYVSARGSRCRSPALLDEAPARAPPSARPLGAPAPLRRPLRRCLPVFVFSVVHLAVLVLLCASSSLVRSAAPSCLFVLSRSVCRCSASVVPFSPLRFGRFP